MPENKSRKTVSCIIEWICQICKTYYLFRQVTNYMIVKITKTNFLVGNDSVCALRLAGMYQSKPLLRHLPQEKLPKNIYIKRWLI